MKYHELINTTLDSVTVKRVYGDPYASDGVTIIPAAVVSGGVGGGTGHDQQGREGEGGGLGLNARPAGAYVIRIGDITWRPAYDLNRVVTAVGMIAIIYLVNRPRVARAQAAQRLR